MSPVANWYQVMVADASKPSGSLALLGMIHVQALPRSLILLLACIVVLPLLTYALSSISFRLARNSHGTTRSPPMVPFWIPFICHAGNLISNPAQLFEDMVKIYGSKQPLKFKAAFLDFVVVSDPTHITTVFKSSKWLSSKPATLFSLKYLLKSPSSAAPFYEADDSGMSSKARKESSVAQEDRIHYWQAVSAQKFLSGQHLIDISERYLTTLRRNLAAINITEEWTEMPDLYHFLQMNVSRSAIESIMGSKILEMHPTLVEDFWTFDRNVPKFLRCMPRWLIPSAYRNRDTLLQKIKEWHAYAHEHSDCKRLGPGDQEWDQYFGHKIIKARQEYAMKMKPMTAEARASEDLGLMFASNANVLPVIFWFIFEALKDSNLRSRMMTEVEPCVSPTTNAIDITKLAEQNLLQSTYAETLRLRVAIAMTRVNEFSDFDLHGYKIPQHQTMVIFSRTSALNTLAWEQAGRTLKKPLEEFHAERFLVNDQQISSETDAVEVAKETTTTNSTTTPSTPFKFSLDGLAGCWIPYGGGQRMCPGRHFAKNEILGTFALLFSAYELQLADCVQLDKVQPDLSWYPVGALPPVGKVPFRIRRRV